MAQREYLFKVISSNQKFFENIIGHQYNSIILETYQHLVMAAILKHTRLDKDYVYIPLEPRMVADG